MNAIQSFRKEIGNGNVKSAVESYEMILATANRYAEMSRKNMASEFVDTDLQREARNAGLAGVGRVSVT